MNSRPFICNGCQPKRNISGPVGIKNKAPATHHCLGMGCACGSCNEWKPVTPEQYQASIAKLTWMAKLGGFYIDNSKTFIKMVKQRKLKPDG